MINNQSGDQGIKKGTIDLTYETMIIDQMLMIQGIIIEFSRKVIF